MAATVFKQLSVLFRPQPVWPHFLQVKRAIQLRNIMTSLGPAYIKLGQALSIRPDLLSPAAMNELQKLCDKVRSGLKVAFLTGSMALLVVPWPI